MTRWALAGLVMAGTLALGAAPQGEDAKLAAFFKDYLDRGFKRSPLEATRQGDHRFDHLLDDVSPAGRAASVEAVRKALADLPAAVTYARLSRDGQIDFETLKHHLEYALWLDANTKPFEDDPRTYNPYISDSVYLLFTQSTLPRERNVANAAGRIAAVPRVVAAARAGLKHPPKDLLDTAVKQNLGAINFYEKGVFEVSGETPQISPLAAPARQAVAALKEYQQFLEGELAKRATGDWRLGKERFSKKLELELDAGLTAEQVLAEAEAEADRVEREMVVVARQLWGKCYPARPLPPDDPAGRRELVREVLAHLGKDHGTVEGLVGDARGTVERVKRFIADRNILKLPDPDRCQVTEMPEFQRGFSVAYLNPAPPLDPNAASVYAVSPPPRDWDSRRVTTYLEEYNRAMLQILTIHEAYPGHYVQLEYSNRHPSPVRKILYSGVFAEGWAVYTEQMMLDQGYGDGDLSLRLHQLKFYLRAVINAILDHKMHSAGMTDAEALELLTKRGFQSEAEAVGKVSRAKQSSCQLSTYFVGRMAFYRLRQALSRELGDRFELAKFHEAVLSNGTLAVKYLPEVTRTKLAGDASLNSR